MSYNVNDKVPPKGTLELKGLVGGDDEETSDLIVVGLQEAGKLGIFFTCKKYDNILFPGSRLMWEMGLDLRSQALLISQGNSRADSWEVALFAGLGDKSGEYEKVYISPASILISLQK